MLDSQAWLGKIGGRAVATTRPDKKVRGRADASWLILQNKNKFAITGLLKFNSPKRHRFEVASRKAASSRFVTRTMIRVVSARHL